MKQLTKAQLRKLALQNKASVKSHTRYAMEDWVVRYASYIVSVETKAIDKTFFGRWPKGWRVAMREQATKEAEDAVIKEFVDDKCFLMDDAIWLTDWEEICKA